MYNSSLSLHPGSMMFNARPGPPFMKGPKKPLAALPLACKAESVVSITSQCSYSSTIVHVGDKKLQPESGDSPLPPPPMPAHTPCSTPSIWPVCG